MDAYIESQFRIGRLYFPNNSIHSIHQASCFIHMRQIFIKFLQKMYRNLSSFVQIYIR